MINGRPVMRLIRPYDDPARDEFNPPRDRFLTPSEQRRLLDRDAGPLWVIVVLGAGILALLIGVGAWLG